MSGVTHEQKDGDCDDDDAGAVGWFEEFALRMPFLTSSRKGRGEDERQKLVQMKVALNSFLTRGWLAHPSSEEQRRPLG